VGKKLEVIINLPTKKKTKQQPPRVSTETIEYRSHSLNYGKLTPLNLYVVWCPKCGRECSITRNVIDGEEKYGTIHIEDVKISLHSAYCRICDWEHFFT